MCCTCHNMSPAPSSCYYIYWLSIYSSGFEKGEGSKRKKEFGLEPICCKIWQKSPNQKSGLKNWSKMSMSVPVNHVGSIWFHSEPLKYGSEEKSSSFCKCSILLGFIMSKKLRGLWFYLLIKVQNATSIVFLT